MSNWNSYRLKELAELFDAYVSHWDGIQGSSVHAMQRLLEANIKIQRVREVIEKESYDDEANNPVVSVEDLLKALDGEK